MNIEHPMKSKENLVWIDCEMTGLDPRVNRIIEIAVIITDSRLNILAEGPSIAISQSKKALSAMDHWNRTHHRRSGLLAEVRASTVTTAQAEQEILKFVRQYCYRGRSPLCGNSVGYDRSFLSCHMPELHEFFHYQNIDVSTIKQLVNRWYPKKLHLPAKKDAHRALPDIRGSIEELRYYRDKVFR